MTLRERIRAGAVVLMVALFALAFVFLGNQRLAHAQLADQILCFINGNSDAHSGISYFPTFDVSDCNTDGGTSVPSGTLTLVDEVVNTGGGTAQAGDWTLSADGSGMSISGASGSSAVTDALLQTGPYALSESGPSGYTADSWSCSGATITGNVLMLGNGDNATCTIVNTFNAGTNSGGGNGGDPTPTTGTLDVVKTVIGGDASPSDFSIHVGVDGSDIPGSPQPGSSGGTMYTLAPGFYQVSETGGPSGYTGAFSEDCNSDGFITVVAGDTAICLLKNTFSGSGTSGGGSDPSDLSLTKTASELTASVGDPITYTITVTNNGPDDASGVAVTEAWPAGLTYATDDSTSTGTTYDSATGVWAIGTLKSGASEVLHITGTVNMSASGGMITNSATASDTNGDSNSANNTGTASVSVSSATSSDLALTKSANGSAFNIGDHVTYTLTASNSGPAAASGVTVTDLLPSGLTYISDDSTSTGTAYATSTGIWTIGSLGTSSSDVLHIVASVNSGTAGQTITNSATITDTNGDPNSANNAANAAISVNNPVSGGGGGGSPAPSTPTGAGNGPIVRSYGGGGIAPIIPTGLPAGMVLGASTSTVSATSCPEYVAAFIKMGQQNDPTQVMHLQTVLKDYEGANVQINGVYDAATLAAVDAFQAKYASDVLAPWGISSPTGYVYLTTRREINEVYCHFTQNFPLTTYQESIIAASRVNTGSIGAHAAVSGTRKHGSLTEEQQAAAAEASMTNSTSSKSASSSVTSNPFSSIGNFFKKIFGGH